jgi:ABC-2 type transport system permease protein
MMSGILLKDFLYLRQQSKFLLLLFGFFIIFFTVTGNQNELNSLFTTLIVMLTSILVINTFSYDEVSKWDSYAFSLPVARKQTVLCKYLLTLILALAGMLIALCIDFVANHGMSAENYVALYSAFGFSIIFCSVLIPMFYKFGTQKARLAIMIVILLSTFGLSLLKRVNLPVPSDDAIKLLVALSPLFLIIIFITSYLISSRIMENKEI